VLESIIIMRQIGGRVVKYIIIALGVVILLWIISLIIQRSDKRARERHIKQKQEQRKLEEEAKERANRPSFPTG
jgi:flagellar biosynthesis/type III secretory pathway M-ring protein FliF/YscJ